MSKFKNMGFLRTSGYRTCILKRGVGFLRIDTTEKKLNGGFDLTICGKIGQEKVM